jgi:two-component system alkaline phosphatase synthesis response regulator PhoP
MEAYRILLVEDEASLALALTIHLELEGFDVVHVSDGETALSRIRNMAFHLIILDVMLPHMSGLTICENIRLSGIQTPIIFLSARGSGKERIEGLKAGGDDHLTKPFEMEELLLRMRNLLSRKDSSNVRDGNEKLEFDGGKVDFQAYLAINFKGETVELSKREFMLLKLLASRSGEVVSREEILDRVWGLSGYPNARTIDNFILNFRKHFERDNKNPRHFHSVRGVGYRFDPR